MVQYLSYDMAVHKGSMLLVVGGVLVAIIQSLVFLSSPTHKLCLSHAA